jgi:tetratricopeptide (TPR) repeat protein
MAMNEILRASDTAGPVPDNREVLRTSGPARRDLMVAIQQTALQIQEASLEAQRLALGATDPAVKDTAVSLQLGAAKLLKAAMSLEVLADSIPDQALPASAAAYCEKATELLGSGRIEEATTLFRAALQLDPHYAPAHKGLGDAHLQSAEPEQAIRCYEKARQLRPDYADLDNNLALAHLATFDHERAEPAFRKILFRDHGLPESAIKSFDAGTAGTNEIGHASPFKLVDRIDQLNYLLSRRQLDTSFQGLVASYRSLLAELKADKNRIPYTPLTADQLRPFRGYYDKLLHYRDTPRLGSPAVNPDLNWKAIEEEYLDTRCLSFDDLLTPAALAELRGFFMESTIFFRQSEAGFVGTYITDGFSCGLIFQFIDELRLRLPRLLTDKPINNMWCYRYNDRGHGVRPHNGDGSVTINFYLTPDEANIGDPNGGGMVMYDKVHPKDWDWLTFNLHKDDPGIQAQISEYLKDAKATTVPYRCNRAVLFHSTLFHKTDPFEFRDDYESRRMNITMLFGRRGEESAPLK